MRPTTARPACMRAAAASTCASPSPSGPPPSTPTGRSWILASSSIWRSFFSERACAIQAKWSAVLTVSYAQYSSTLQPATMFSSGAFVSVEPSVCKRCATSLVRHRFGVVNTDHEPSVARVESVFCSAMKDSHPRWKGPRSVSLVRCAGQRLLPDGAVHSCLYVVTYRSSLVLDSRGAKVRGRSRIERKL